MEYLITKGTGLSNDPSKIETEKWFNLWGTKKKPYVKLVEGDTLYWYDKVKEKLVWKTKVTYVERYPYSDKNDVYEIYKDHAKQEYFDSKPQSGYFLRYEVKVIEKLDVPKPKYNIDRLGWEEMDSENWKRWFGEALVIDDTTLDDSVILISSPLQQMLQDLDEKMRYVSPERVKKLVATTIRKDTAIIKAIKQGVGYKCQFPGCGHQIRKKDGGYYIEVAHIEPVKDLGQSILGNLLVLCPNHHKEFDYGDRVIKEQTVNRISGFLNGKAFLIETKNND